MSRSIDRLVVSSLRHLLHRRPRRQPIRRRPADNSVLRFEALETRIVLTGDPVDLQAIIDAYNVARPQFQSADYAGLANTILETDLPFIDESLADALGIANLLANGAGNAPSLSVGSTLGQIESALVGAGFIKEYLDTTAEAVTGDLLRFRLDRTIVDTTPLFNLAGETGFDYFDSAVDGTLGGSLNATFQPMTLSITFGVDIQNNVLQFFLEEGEVLNIAGIDITGSVDANIAIRNLVDVDVVGPITGNLSGSLSLVDADGDDKLRLAQLADLPSLAAGTMDGSIEFDPTLTATLPFVGDITWTGHCEANFVDGTLDTITIDPFANIDTGAIAQAVIGNLQNAYNAIVGQVDILGGVPTGTKLPAVNKSLGEALGLPSFAGLGTGSGLSVTVNEDTIRDLINGKSVDLIHYQISDGDSYSENYSFPILSALVPIGPIPLSASLSLQAGVSASYSYFAGFGIDTTGFYIDANTSISGAGGLFTGINASVGIFGVLDVNVSAGVGASIGARIGIHDPDGDGRLYLEEIIADLEQGQGNIGEELLARMDASLFGEAYGYARGVVEFLFWDWTIFDEQFTISPFGTSLGGMNNPRDDSIDYRTALNRPRPVGTGELDANLLQNGVLTLDMNTQGRGDLSNSVSLRSTEGGIEVVWRGVGTRVYAGVDTLMFTGNEKSDRLTIGEGLAIHVVADGRGEADYLEGGGLSSTLIGGDGSDSLIGGALGDSLLGGLGVDVIEGQGGNDSIYGGDKGDIIEGGTGNDTIQGQAGEDQISGGADGDYIVGGNEWDVIHGDGGNDTIQGNDGKDQLFGDAGADTIYGGADEDILVGGDGNDRIEGGSEKDLIYGDNGDPLATFGGNDTLLGQAGDDYAFGEGGDDVIYGDDSLVGTDGGNDILSGDAGNDVIVGGTGQISESGEGADIIFGGLGNDSLMGSRGPDQISGGTGTDTLDGGYGNDILFLDFEGAGTTALDVLRGGVDQDMLAISGKTQLVKPVPADPSTYHFDDNFDDIIELRQIDANHFDAIRYATVGGVVADTISFFLDGTTNGDIERLGLFGRGGNDTLYASSNPIYAVYKNLTLNGGLGNDLLTGGKGQDSIVGSANNDTLFGGDGSDILEGDAGEDKLYGEAGNDSLYGDTPGDANFGDKDTLDGGAGRDFTYGGGGNDLILVGAGILGDFAKGEAGNDTLIGGEGIDELDGGIDDDLILGGELNDILRGDAGNDTLVGEQGRDSLDGGLDNDVLHAWLANQFRAGIEQLHAISLPAVVTYTEPELETIRVQQISPVLTKLIAITDLLDNPSLPPAILNLVQQFKTKSTLSAAEWQQWHDAVVPTYLTAAQWNEFVYRTVDSPIDARISIEANAESWGQYYAYVWSDLLTDGVLVVDVLRGGSGNDSLFGSPFPDVLDGEAGDDSIYHTDTPAIAGPYNYMPGFLGEDIVKGGSGGEIAGDRYVFLGTEGVDVFEMKGVAETVVRDEDVDDDNLDERAIVHPPGFPTGNLLVGIYLNGATVPEGYIGWIDIEIASIESLGGDDTIKVNFGNQAIKKVYIDGGSDKDWIDAAGVFDASQVALQAKATLLGGDGNDTLIGGLSDDSIWGGDGLDILDGNGGNDSLYGQADNDTLTGGAGNDLLYGNESSPDYGDGGIDTIKESSDVDMVLAFYSYVDRTIRFQGGPTLGTDYSLQMNNAILTGGAGNNTIDASGFPAPVTIYGGGGDDVIFGSPEADFLFGEDGVDRIYGKSGNDFVHGGNNNDTLYGEGSDDIVYGGAGADFLYGGLGGSVFDGHDYLNGGDGNDGFDGGLGNDTIIGGMGEDSVDEHKNVPAGSSYINYIFGDLGPDPDQSTIFTETGLDAYLHVGNGDFLRGDVGRDYIVGGGGIDTVFGGFGAGGDVLFGGDNDDLIHSNGGYGEDTPDPNYNYGDDEIHGGNGNDRILGSRGNDTIHGGAGNDFIKGYQGQDIIYGGEGNDHITEHTNDGPTSPNWIDAGSGDDFVFGDAALDTIYGGSGNDTLYGGFDAVQDLIDGGTGLNWITQDWNGNNLVQSGYNNPPVVVTPSIVSVTEGQDRILSAAGSYDPDGDPLVNYSVEINFGGVLRTFSSTTPTITVPWAMIADVADGGQSYAATVNVQDENDEPGLDGMGSQSITINAANAAPSMQSIAALATAVRGEPVKFTLSATDPSLVDQAAGFTFRIDWDGNGSIDQTVIGQSGVQVTHVFATSGSYSVRVTAMDKDGGVSPVATHSVNVVNWMLRQDPNNPSKTDLIWGGTNGFDAYGFVPGLVFIQAQNNVFFGSPQVVFTGGFNGKVYVYAQGSGDLVFADVMSASMVIDGGDGDDVLVGGRGADSISGGNGNDIIFGGTLESDASDTLVGGSGDDLIVGHFGADVLKGGTGQDLIVAGRLNFVDLPGAVFGIQAEWLSGRPIAERVANLSGTGTGDRNNGDTFLIPGLTVLDDSPTPPAVIDQVFGEADDDWLLYDFGDDLAPDVAAGDVTTNLG